MNARRRERKRDINAFRVGDAYLFKHHFEPDIFDLLRPHYDEEEYRFEVLAEEMPGVEEFLAENLYDIALIQDPQEYCVVTARGEEQPQRLFENAVMRTSTPTHHVYLLEDLVAVEEAVYGGADRLVESDIEDPF